MSKQAHKQASTSTSASTSTAHLFEQLDDILANRIVSDVEVAVDLSNRLGDELQTASADASSALTALDGCHVGGLDFDYHLACVDEAVAIVRRIMTQLELVARWLACAAEMCGDS